MCVFNSSRSVHQRQDGGEHLPLRLHCVGVPEHRSSRDHAECLSGKYPGLLHFLKTKADRTGYLGPECQEILSFPSNPNHCRSSPVAHAVGISAHVVGIFEMGLGGLGWGWGVEGYVHKYALTVLFVRLNGMRDMLIS